MDETIVARAAWNIPLRAVCSKADLSQHWPSGSHSADLKSISSSATEPVIVRGVQAGQGGSRESGGAAKHVRAERDGGR